MSKTVTDIRSNSNDQVAHAVKVIGRSKARRSVFEQLHRGKQRIKTATQLAELTGLSRQHVLNEAKVLVREHLIEQTTRDNEIAYEPDTYLYSRLNQVLRMVDDPKKLEKLPTKYSPKGTGGTTIKITGNKQMIRTRLITLTDIGSFAKGHKIKNAPAVSTMKEKTFKTGVQKIIGQKGTFKDWGGETSDLYSTRLEVSGSKRATAFAFKGRGKKGALSPADFGSNGDQIQRLFVEDADVFIVQYVGELKTSIVAQMATNAKVKSWQTGRVIYYGVLDGQDSAQIVAGYPKAFGKGKGKG